MPPSSDKPTATQARAVPDDQHEDRHLWLRRPAYARRLVGRESELQELREHLDEGVLIISGTGGSGLGATALARRLAIDAMDRRANGFIELDLRGADALEPQVTAPARFQHRVIRTVAPDLEIPEDDRARRSQYLAALEENRPLLILDDVASVVQLRALLPRRPSGIIVTSQEDISASFPHLHALRLDGLAPERAHHLAIQVAPELVDQSRRQIARVTARVAELPLAVCVLAPWLAPAGPLPPRRMLQALDAAEQRIVALRGDRTPDILVDMAMEVAYDHLPQENRPRFASLAIFPAPFAVAAAAAIWDLEAQEAAAHLNGLATLSLIHRAPGSDHFEMHPRIRQFAQALLLSQPTRSAQLVARYIAHTLREAAQASARWAANPETARAADATLLWEHLPTAWRRLTGEDPGWPRPTTMDPWIADFPRHGRALLEATLPKRVHRAWLSQSLAAAEKLHDTTTVAWLRETYGAVNVP